MEVKAITRNVRLSASKGRDLARAVQGKPLAAALKIDPCHQGAILHQRLLRSGSAAVKEEV